MNRWVKRVAEAKLPTPYGTFCVIVYQEKDKQVEHVALVIGDVSNGKPVLTRIHDECLTGEVFGSLRCDCGEQLEQALVRIGEEGRGVLLYMRQEGRGIGLHNKILAYALQDQGMDTVEANVALGFPPDGREYTIASLILIDLGVKQLRLLTNNPAKQAALETAGLAVVERLAIEVSPNLHNIFYLKTKQKKMGHLFTIAQLKNTDSFNGPSKLEVKLTD